MVKFENMRYFLPIFLFTFSSFVFSQKNQINTSACDPTTTKLALKYFKQSEKAKDNTSRKELMNKAIAADAYYYEAHFELGFRYYKAKNYALCKDHLESVKEICPNYSPYTFYYLGYCYLQEESWQKALDAFKKFVEFDITDNDKYDEIKNMIPELQDWVDIVTKPVPFDPKPVKGVCSSEDEYLGSLSPDNRSFYYTRKKYVTNNNMNSGVGGGPTIREFFTVSSVTVDGYDGGKFMEKPFNDKYNNGSAAVTADNKHMYFVICENNDVNYCDIWYTDFVKGQWTALKNMGQNINSLVWDSQPTVSYDGKTLVFSSMRSGGQGGSDLWMCSKKDDGTWGVPVNMGNVINTSANELTPFLHSDSQTLYFASKGHKGLGGYDLFYAKKDSAGNWMKPRNLGFPINTEADETSLFVSLDGKTAYMTSDRVNEYKGIGGLDIYSWELYAQARPEEVLFVEGQVTTTNDKPVKGEVEIKNLRTNEVKKVDIDSTDGTYVAIVTNKDDYILSVKEEGLAFTSTVIEKDKTPVGTPTTQNLKTDPIKVGSTFKLNDINFATNSWELNEKSKFIIKEFSEFMKINPKVKIAIQGHTDNVGDDNKNLTLSDNRAKAVYEYLVSLGVAKERMTYKGFGETKPVSTNNSEFGRAKNRRTEFLITEK